MSKLHFHLLSSIPQGTQEASPAIFRIEGVVAHPRELPGHHRDQRKRLVRGGICRSH